MIGKSFKYALISLFLIVVQTQATRLLSIDEITPDILMIWIVYLALRTGQISGTLWGFAIGLVFDLVTGNFIGLSEMTKTISGFVAGYFYNENKTQLILRSYQFMVIVLVVGVIHNTIYFLIFTQGSDIGFIKALVQYGLSTALYTSIVTLLPMFSFARKYQG
jgi:rod shape-determining protein MreD